MLGKPTPKSHIAESKSSRGNVRKQDHGLQRALNGDRQAIGQLCFVMPKAGTQ